jgi:hypothetical protein
VSASVPAVTAAAALLLLLLLLLLPYFTRKVYCLHCHLLPGAVQIMTRNPAASAQQATWWQLPAHKPTR